MKISNDFGNKLKGSVGEQVTASDWKGRNYLKAYSRPSNPSTPQQEAKRTFLADGMALWQGFTEYQKEAYYFNERFLDEKLSPLNSFLRTYLNLKNAGLGYTAPVEGQSICDDLTIPANVPNVHVALFYTGRTVPLRELISGDNSFWRWALTVEDQNYEAVLTKEGYEIYYVSSRTANAMSANTYHLTPL